MIPGPPKRNCPTPDKKVFTSLDVADKRLLQVLGEMVCHEKSGPMPIRSYHCKCGYFHHTHLEKKCSR